MVYMFVYIIGSLPASYIVDKKSLRLGITIGSILNTLGAIIRCFPFPLFTISEMNPYSFYVVFFGQLLAAISQTFFLAIPPKIVQRWFGSNERVFATSVASSCNQLGTAFGLVIPSFIVQGKGENISYLLLLCAILSSISSALIIVFFQNYPKTPPSVASAIEKKHVNSKKKQAEDRTDDDDLTDDHQSISYLDTFKSLFRDKNYMILFTITGLLQGSSYAFSTLFGQMLLLIKYTDKEASILAFLFIGFGILGAIIISSITDKFKLPQRVLIVICTIMCLFATLEFTFLCTSFDKFIQLIICCSILGFFETGVLPLFMDSSVEITYPLPQAITTNLVMTSPQVFGIIFILVAGWFLERDNTPEQVVLSANAFLMFWIVVSLILSVFYYPESKRLNTERAAAVDDSQNDVSNSDGDHGNQEVEIIIQSEEQKEKMEDSGEREMGEETTSNILQDDEEDDVYEWKNDD